MRRFSLKFLCGALPAVFMAGVMVGCAPVPPAIMLASQAIDGISYLATGKSGSDHALSAALEEDCALFRVLMGDAVCRIREPDLALVALPDRQTASLMAFGDGDTLADVDDDAVGELAVKPSEAASLSVASAVAARDPGTMSGMAAPGADMFFAPYNGKDSRRQHRRAAPRRDTVPAEAAPKTVLPGLDGEDTALRSSPLPEPRYHVVLASFDARATAERALSRVAAACDLAELSADAPVVPRIVMKSVSGSITPERFDIVAGPYARAQAEATYRRIVDVGFGPTRMEPFCAVEGTCGLK